MQRDNETNRTLQIYAAEKMRDIRDFVNENRIAREDILSIQESKDGDYMLIYFVNE